MSSKYLIPIALAVAAALVLTSSAAPLNVRNNNPLNVRDNPANDWQGQIGARQGFARFRSVDYGFRAAYITLQTYRTKHGADTIDTIVRRWAPPSENHTQNYINYVSQRVNLSPFAPLEPQHYPLLIDAMADMEGPNNWTLADVQQGVNLAL
ncbi:hypothetical protein MHM93_07850 [Pseudoalteromonas sp. MM17-2]|uniref:hypothetical protein n=1 Tax=Pseudoalteromonas sp. MM17-2 TaxID=2917753 RepID=UPI001EF741E2|nr:hypothetical protein [Pseudoalteromonas sp. MM17-2]MCG7544093.1 hypothetical protein [Pseudoalteromonas sp. MM17-2]